jgi:hypothetical protein
MESILDTIDKTSETNTTPEKDAGKEPIEVTSIPTRLAEVVAAPTGESAASPIQFAAGIPPMPVAIPATEIEVPVAAQEDVQIPPTITTSAKTEVQEVGISLLTMI